MLGWGERTERPFPSAGTARTVWAQRVTISENILWQGTRVTLTWEADAAPPGLPVRQVSGVCFTEAGKIVLVSEDGRGWTLPGGHPEADETPHETLAREVLEEACAEVLACTYLGWQRVDDPREPPYLQLRYVARVRPLDFQPEYEMRRRTTVSSQDFLSTLSWGESRIAAALLQAALKTPSS